MRTMSGIKLLRNIFNLHPGEGPLVFLMMVISAANGIAINYYFTASSTLFIEHFDIQILPWTIIASGVALYATQIIYSFFQKRLAATNFLLVSLIFVVAMLAAISISLALIEAPWLIFVIVVLFRVMILVIIIGFWSLANRLFTLLQGKRLYPVISAGDVISISIGSFLLPFIVRLIGVENLFLIVMVSIIINIASVLIIQGKYRERLAETEPLQVSVPQQRQGNPLRSYYILLIFVLFVVGWTFNYALDYAFLGQLQSRYSSDPTAFLRTFTASVRTSRRSRRRSRSRI
jgi:predicted MFS family arabinose efflux permease